MRKIAFYITIIFCIINITMVNASVVTNPIINQYKSLISFIDDSIINASIPTGSMENTIMPNDYVIASKLYYINNKPERGDIVIFKTPDDIEQLYLKRIIGIPGDKVEIKDSFVYINNEIIEEPYLKETMSGNWGPYNVPENSYFVLGDNRNNSQDSRYWQNTFVQEDAILGKVLLKYFPVFKKLNK